MQLADINKLRVLDRGPELGSSVTFTVNHLTPDYVVNQLLQRKINVVATFRDYAVIDFDEKEVRWAIRVSPHYYNTIEEIDDLAGSVRSIL